MEIWFIVAWLAATVVLMEIVLVLRRGAGQYRGYLALLAANLALLGWLVEEERTVRESGAPTVELVGALVATVLLVFVPRLLDRGARWAALNAERLVLATRLSGIKEILVPGLASSAEHAWYSQMARAQGGDSVAVLSELRQQLIDAEPPNDLAIQERMVTMLVYARRYREAVSQFETHLSSQLLAPVGTGGAEGVVLRHPAMAIQMVRALGELGELDKAAQLVHRLGFAARGPLDPTLQAVLLQTRLYLLAFAGRVDDVARILETRPLRRMPRRMRAFFNETARAHAGRVPATTAVAASITSPTDGSSASPDGAGQENLARYLDHVAERTQTDVQALAQAPSRSFAPATFALVVTNLVAYGLFWLLLGDTITGEHLLRGGATYDPAVRSGEWWRLWTAMFLHGGLLHLGLNLYGLHLLGRVVEPILGWGRFVVVYAVAGLAGNLASVYSPTGRAVFSLGASGAIMGIVGALLVTLILRKGIFPERWRRDLMLNLVLLLVMQFSFGLKVPFIDNFAHLGGLFGGVAAALVLAPGGLLGRGRVPTAVVSLMLGLLGASAVQSVISLVRERPAATLGRLGRETVRVGRVALSVLPGYSRAKVEPPPFPDAEELFEHPVGLLIEPHLVPLGGGVQDVLRALMAHDVEQLAEQAKEHAGSAAVEAAVAPMAGAGSPNPEWTGVAQRIPDSKNPQLLLYYARALDAQTAVVVELNHRGEIPRGGLVEDELARVLQSVVVAPAEHGPVAAPSQVAAPAPAQVAAPAPAQVAAPVAAPAPNVPAAPPSASPTP